MTSGRRDELKSNAIAAVTSYARTHPEEIQAWRSQSAIAEGLQKMLNENPLPKMKGGKSEIVEDHTGESLHRLLKRHRIPTNPQYYVSEIFSKGVELLETENADTSGSRPQYPTRLHRRQPPQDQTTHTREKAMNDRHQPPEPAVNSTSAEEATSFDHDVRPEKQCPAARSKRRLEGSVERLAGQTHLNAFPTSSLEDQTGHVSPSKKAKQAAVRSVQSEVGNNRKEPGAELEPPPGSEGPENHDRPEASESFLRSSHRRQRSYDGLYGLSRQAIHDELDRIHDQITKVADCLTIVRPDAATATLLSEPDDALKALYERVFGSSSFREAFFEQGKIYEVDLLTALVAAWLWDNILDKTSPWRTDVSLRTAPGNIWSAFITQLEADNVAVQPVIDRAAFALLEDPVFQEQALAENVTRLSEIVSMTLWPQAMISHNARKLRRDADGGLAWRTHLRMLVKQCLLLRARLEATYGFRFEWRWFKGGESADSTQVQDIYERSGPFRVGMNVVPAFLVGA